MRLFLAQETCDESARGDSEYDATNQGANNGQCIGLQLRQKQHNTNGRWDKEQAKVLAEAVGNHCQVGIDSLT